jgi:hypothetical protein
MWSLALHVKGLEAGGVLLNFFGFQLKFLPQPPDTSFVSVEVKRHHYRYEVKNNRLMGSEDRVYLFCMPAQGPCFGDQFTLSGLNWLSGNPNLLRLLKGIVLETIRR